MSEQRDRRPRPWALVTGLAIAVLMMVQLAGVAAARSEQPAANNARAAACRAPAREYFRISGPIHACGTSLVDRAGHRVRLLSYEVLNLYGGQGDVHPECGHWAAPPPDLAGHLRAWGMNSVQILISWSNIEPTPPTPLPGGGLKHHWDQSYLTALDTAIGQFRAQGIAVVLSLGQSRWSHAFRNLELPNGNVQACGLGMPSWLYPRGGGMEQMLRAERQFFRGTDGVQDQFRRVWKMLALRYKQNPAVVGAEMLFEAYDIIAMPFQGHRETPASVDLAGFYERTGRAIHLADPGLLVLYADWQSRNARLYFAITRKPNLPNAAYSYEFYGQSWSLANRTRFARYQQRAKAWGVPAWIDEFDAFQYGRRTNPDLPGNPHWKRDTLALLARAQREGLGWSFVGAMDDELAAVLPQGH